MIRLIKRMFDDVHRLANFVTANPPQETYVFLSPTDRDLLMNFRRRRPSMKKEAA
jgi:hypothetical protein